MRKIKSKRRQEPEEESVDPDDEEIAYLEEKLGLDKGSKKYPKEFEEEIAAEGYLDLLNYMEESDDQQFEQDDGDGFEEEEEEKPKKKSKKDFDEEEEEGEGEEQDDEEGEESGRKDPEVKLSDLVAQFLEKKSLDLIPKIARLSHSDLEDQQVDEVIKKVESDFWKADSISSYELNLLLLCRGLIRPENASSVYLFLRGVGEHSQDEDFLLKLTYVYLFQLISDSTFTSFIVDEIKASNFEVVFQSLTLAGKFIRKAHPASIIALSSALQATSSEEFIYQRTVQLIQNIKANKDIATKYPLNFIKLRNALKPMKRILKDWGNKDYTSSRIKSADFSADDTAIAEEKKQTKGEHAELLQKYEQLFDYLQCPSTNQKLVVAMIVDNEDFAVAASKIMKLKIFKHNLDEIPKAIFRLYLSEKKLNEHYIRLSNQLCIISKDLHYSFYHKIWSFYTTLSKKPFTTKAKRIAIFAAKMLALGTLNFKMLKNFDFSSIYQGQKKFNIFFFKELLLTIGINRLRENTMRLPVDDGAEMLKEEIRDFAVRFSKKYVDTLFGSLPDDQKEKLLEKIEIFVDL